MNSFEKLDLSQIACSSFSRIPTEELISNPKRKYCTPIAENLSNGLLKTAATRIFSDPSQSFMEIIANSIDAYSGEETIGKFGMGFISNLYWLYDHPNRYIRIESSTGVESWNALIFFSERYQMNFEITNKKSIHTLITIGFPDLNDPRIFRSFFTSISKFVDLDIRIQLLEVNIQARNEIVLFDNLVDSKKIILIIFNPSNETYFYRKIKLNPREIVFLDFATGISKQVFFKSMLVSSSSTKKKERDILYFDEEIFRRDLNDKKYIPNFRHSNKLHLKSPYGIVVGNVVIVPMNFNYYIDFPLHTRVTVARDDIIISNQEEIEILEYKIHKILELSIQRSDTSLVLRELKVYQNYTDQMVIKEIIQTSISTFLMREDIILVPRMYDIFKTIEYKIIIQWEHSQILDISFLLEQKFANQRLGKIGDKNVVLIQNLGGTYTTAGTNTMLFIDQAFYESDPKHCIENIILSFQGEYIPNNTIRDIIYDEVVVKYINLFSSSPVYYDLMKDVFAAGYKFSENFVLKLWDMDKEEHIEQNTENFIQNLLLKIQFVLQLDQVKDESKLAYFSKLYTFFTTYQGEDVIYGEDKPQLIFNQAIDAGNLIPEDKEEREMLLRDLNLIGKINEDILAIQIELDYLALKECEFFVIENHLNYILGKYPDFTNQLYPIAGLIDTVLMILTFDHYEGLNDEKLKLNKDELLFILSELKKLGDDTFLKRTFCNAVLDLSGSQGEDFYTAIYNPLHVIFDLFEKNRNPKFYSLPSYSIQIQNFYLTGLIQHIITYPVDLNDISWLKDINSNPMTISTNIIDIATNTGTTKDIIPSILTELVQNSRDAIMKSNSEHKIRIDTFQFENKFVLSVKDKVGIPISAIPSLLIPFLSNKKIEGNYIPVGSMGTGFFNVYRQPLCERVYIRTSPPETDYTIIIEAIPILQNDRINDIHYSFFIEKRNIVGTSIDIVMREDKRIESESFVKNILSTINIPIQYDDFLYQRNILFQFDSSHYQIILFDTEDHMIPNIQVGGIPVIKISDYQFKEKKRFDHVNHFNYNFIINLLPTIKILPNQSRNRLIISDESDRKILEKSICDALYIHLLYNSMIVNPHTKEKIYYKVDPLIYGFSSKTDFIQTTPFSGNEKISNYMFGNRKYTLVNIIQEISRNITDNIQEVVEEVLLRYNLFEIEKDLIREWYKNKTLPNNEMHIELLLGNQEGKDEIHFQLDYLTLFTKIFWYIGREKQLSGYFKGEIFQFLTEPPLVYITSSLEPEVHGEYVSDLHTIYLNVLHHPTIQKDFDYLKTLTDKDLIVNYIYNHMKYFVNSSSIPTVYIHELSHAWRKQDEGIHDSVFLEINGKRAEYEFDPAALTIYREITKFGLYPQFLESL